ncbi:MAG: rhodanese-like domain-containing protein [Vicinamibacteria bacterium]
MKTRRILLAALTAGALSPAAFAQPASPVPRTEAEIPRVAFEQFRKDLAAGRIVAIDVRAAEAYRHGHIPGALSVPESDLEARLAELRAAKKPIVAYCA